MPLSHYTGRDVDYFDTKGNPVHLAHMFIVQLDMFVPYIAHENDEPFVVPEMGELYPPKRPFEKGDSRLEDFWLGPPKHRNQRYRAFLKTLPKVVAHQYWMAEELQVYGYKEFKLIESGVVLEGLIYRLLWDVFVMRVKGEDF